MSVTMDAKMPNCNAPRPVRLDWQLIPKDDSFQDGGIAARTASVRWSDVQNDGGALHDGERLASGSVDVDRARNLRVGVGADETGGKLRACVTDDITRIVVNTRESSRWGWRRWNPRGGELRAVDEDEVRIVRDTQLLQHDPHLQHTPLSVSNRRQRRRRQRR